MEAARPAHTMRTFFWIAGTQVLSGIGSRMTGIALGIRIFQDTGSTTPVMLTSLFSALPLILGGSFAGVLVDHWKRRTVLLLTDSISALCTLLLMTAFFTGHFALWQLYLLSFIGGIMDMFQRPAMEASTTMLVPERHRDRANVVRQLIGPIAGIIAPVVTGFVYALIDVTGVMMVDLATYLAAAAVVVLVRIPQPGTPRSEPLSARFFAAEYKKGLRFLLDRKALVLLMLLAAVINFLLSGPTHLSTPYILTLTGGEAQLGILLGMMNAGIVVGGVLVAIFGGTRPRVHGIMIGLLFRALCLVLYGVSRSPLMLGISLFFIFFASPLIDASFMSILQAKVPPEMQGRVFSILFQLMYLANPLSYAVTGPLVDRVLEPAVDGAGWQAVAPLVGTQPGSGMGLLMVIAGTLMFAVTAVMYAWRPTRTLERDLPEYAAALQEAQPFGSEPGGSQPRGSQPKGSASGD
ncbi:MAG: MFS transporter [Anaerolineae bacterium]|nr:MFS transporter [Anaerolineae bacterium]